MDRDLIERARSGDQQAFADLVHQVSDTLYGVARRILRDPGLAEDGLIAIALRDPRASERLRGGTGAAAPARRTIGMSDRQFERTVHDWLEDGSDRTPPTAIDAVLFAIRSTPQERDLPIPRRFIQMPNYLRYAAAAIVPLVAVGGAISLGLPSVGPPSASPTLSATTPAPPATQLPASALVPFTSAQYGYTISLPKGWGAQAATRALHPTEPLFGNYPAG